MIRRPSQVGQKSALAWMVGPRLRALFIEGPLLLPSRSENWTQVPPLRDGFVSAPSRKLACWASACALASGVLASVSRMASLLRRKTLPVSTGC